MAAEYRSMTEKEEDAVLGLWLETWPGADLARARLHIKTDPRWLEHTLVAIGEDGAVLATAHHWLHRLRDAGGKARLVGCVSHVSTRASARRQGHARTLMQMQIAAMSEEGCEWTLLYSSEMGKSVYPGLGYRHMSAPYNRGLLSRSLPDAPPGYTVRRYSTVAEAGGWRPLARIYAAYNAGRPLSVARDDAYWEGFLSTKLDISWRGHEAAIFLAFSGDDQQTPVGYLLAQFSTPEYAEKEFGLDQAFTVGEIGAMPGNDAAISALLGAVVENTLPGRVGGRLFVPLGDPLLDGAAQTIFGDTLQRLDDRAMMARPLVSNVSEADLNAMFSAPGALQYLTDEF